MKRIRDRQRREEGRKGEGPKTFFFIQKVSPNRLVKSQAGLLTVYSVLFDLYNVYLIYYAVL